MDSPRRRRLLLGTAGVLGTAGCLRLRGTGDGQSRTRTPPEDAAGPGETAASDTPVDTGSGEQGTVEALAPAWDHTDVEPGYLDEPELLVRDGETLYAAGEAVARIDLSSLRLDGVVELREGANALAVRDDVALVGEMGVDRGALQKVDLAAGETVWTVELEVYDRVTTVAVDGDAVYFAGGNNTPDLEAGLFVADRADGTVELLQEWEGAVIEAIEPHGGSVFLGFSGALVDRQVYDATRDEVRELPVHLGASFVVEEGVLYDGRVAVDLETGDPIYERSRNSPLSTSAHGDVLVAGTRDGILGVDRESGDELWSLEADDRVVTRGVGVADAVFAVDRSGRVYGFDPDTGQLLHAEDLPSAEDSFVATTEEWLVAHGDTLVTCAAGLSAFEVRRG